MGAPKPLTRQRSPWRRVPSTAVALTTFQRRVHDGRLTAFVAEEPAGWHLSISFANHMGAATRYPTWDEITHARGVLLPADVGFVMHLPPDGEYIAVMDSCFHLHEHPERAS